MRLTAVGVVPIAEYRRLTDGVRLAPCPCSDEEAEVDCRDSVVSLVAGSVMTLGGSVAILVWRAWPDLNQCVD